MREGGRLQEPGEAADVARKALGPDLLFHVERGVGGQRGLRVLRGDHGGDGTQPEGHFQIEPTPQLPGHEGMHGAHRGSPPEQVHAAAPKFAGAGAGEDEAVSAPGLDEGVDDVQELGDALNLVDDHVGVRRDAEDAFPQALGAGRQSPVLLRFQEVDHKGVGQYRAQPGGLARSSGTEEEEAAPRQSEESR